MDKTLSTQNLIEYLSKVKGLEVSCFQQQKILNGLQREIDQSYSNIQNWSQTIQQSAPEKPKKRIVGNVFWPILCGLLGLGVGGALYWILLIVLLIPSLFTSSLDGFSEHNVFIGFMIVGFIIGACICVVVRGKDKNDEKREYSSDIKRYNSEQVTSKTNINLANIRIPELQSKLNEAKSELIKTQDILNQVYRLGYLYPKYQALVPVCSILEYLESGRCDMLTGPNGAYNLYENEVRMNIIITKLDDVIYKLDDISDNQRMLANVIRESEQRTHEILNSISNTLSGIRENTEYIRYYSSVAADNSSYLAWLNTLQYVDSRNQ